MARKIWPLLALVGMMSQAGISLGQVLPAAPEVLPAPMCKPAPYMLPPEYQPPAVEPSVSPFLETGPIPPPGPFAAIDLLICRPHVFSHLSGSPNGVDTVNLATAGPIATTVSPEFELGYRLPEQLGEFMIGYRFETADSTFTPTDSLGGLSERDRLSVNLIDVDWSKHNPFSLPPGWDLRVNVGVRVALLYFDTQRDYGAAGNAAGQTFARATNYFSGAGPEAGVELSREVFLPGLAVLGRVSGADLFGSCGQSFSEATVAAPGIVSARNSFQVAAPILSIQAGFRYCPPECSQARFFAGYQWEEIWHFGVLNDNNTELLNRGFWLRAEWNF